MEASRGRGWREGRRRPSATNPHRQPPLSPLAFASSIEGWRMATVRELTTFFRFSRGGGCAERAVGVKRKAEAGRARPPSRSRRAREETPTKGLRQHTSQKLDQRADVLPRH
ncbi:hypothetical protein ALC62_03501 [Cyphomyrmex costatus]|uniref:Uncharacterized protein n=1 Tax=Cyphomyrmex costatus TaxID=456900 RepID=A0A151ILF5_9HYME|nr:hypothetical protein ALC62_03501 [Cyphomyrmex costatus]